jgi:hypothetical protein
MAEGGPLNRSTDRRDFLKAALVTSASTLMPLSASVLAGCAPISLGPTAAPDPAFDAFMELSRQLVGERDLSLALGREYFQRCQNDPDLQSPFFNLLATFGRIQTAGGDLAGSIQTGVMAAPALRDIAQQVIYLWYVSATFSIDPTTKARTWKYGSVEEYEQALVWTVIGAHPPMTHGGPFGYWASAPTEPGNEHDD